MRTKVNVQKTEQITKIICDFCGREITDRYRSGYACAICGKDVCSKCGDEFDNEYLEPGPYFGDYPPYVCQKCWEIGQKYISEIKNIRDSAESKESDLMESWKSEARDIP